MDVSWTPCGPLAVMGDPFQPGGGGGGGGGGGYVRASSSLQFGQPQPACQDALRSRETLLWSRPSAVPHIINDGSMRSLAGRLSTVVLTSFADGFVSVTVKIDPWKCMVRAGACFECHPDRREMHYAKLPLSAQLVLILDAVRCKSPRYRILINADSLPILIGPLVSRRSRFLSLTSGVSLLSAPALILVRREMDGETYPGTLNAGRSAKFHSTR
ncbi:hypothetical protein HPB47_002999 [Ixodes persulcatus]|uniref:Uncharacterized protein n=1 Tax=Ixodes persulcatus TaxID=34615 RepID=A0AC60PJN9_IXOPE|nr:hypothetical protein HPB47_002999 [Ixodes persulcatus]